MPAFLDPFPGITPNKKINKAELIRAIRLDLAAELEASHLYEAHADATSDAKVADLLRDISDEEKVHAGELMIVLETLDSKEGNAWEKGKKEAAKKLKSGVKAI